ncbi:MAG: 16S rRNA (adenine(1518)-N(6)/adenine(1519)-N(6))-dimethyltransferase RsmA [Actinomycetota bacterium]
MEDPSEAGSSTSATRPSLGSPPSAKGSARSVSPGSATGSATPRATGSAGGSATGAASLGRGALRALAERHGIRPTKTLGQNFIADPNLARAIVADAGIGRGDRVLEVGAGLGSITVALAEAGCEVLAVEFDRRLTPALREVVSAYPNVRVEQLDVMRVDWHELLGAERWTMVSNLPYNISVPLMVDLLEGVPQIDRFVVMVQREVGERFVARAGDEAYGTVSVRIAYRADAELLRRIPADVFWPRPNVDSVLVRIDRRSPPVDVDPVALFAVVEESFAERRKTMANALRRLGLGLPDANRVLGRSGVDPSIRGERLGLEDFARVTDALLAEGWRP